MDALRRFLDPAPAWWTKELELTTVEKNNVPKEDYELYLKLKKEWKEGTEDFTQKECDTFVNICHMIHIENYKRIKCLV